jgi:DNA-binding response OmpR family regulator
MMPPTTDTHLVLSGDTALSPGLSSIHTDPASAAEQHTMTKPRILVVDDDEALRLTLIDILTTHDFEVTGAATVAEALHHIHATPFDVLLSDLHMPGAGDGLTVISAMRHSNPDAVTMLLSSFPAMDAAAKAIILQADEILVKPMNVLALVASIRNRLAAGAPAARAVESVAAILERSAEATIDHWYKRVQTDPQIMAISISRAQRCAHLPQLFRDLSHRLLAPKQLGTREIRSQAAEQHGIIRRRQGYTAAMMVEESRELQVSIFETLQNNLASIDFSVLLIGVMTIADEVDSQLSQAMKCYIAESGPGAVAPAA